MWAEGNGTSCRYRARLKNGSWATPRDCTYSRPGKFFLTETHDSHAGADAFRSGAQGFFVKSDAAEELLAAVDAVLVSKQFLSRRSLSTFGLIGGKQHVPC
jgi:DNA-binding NarL/FixJ family response regulator